jgi:Raf kinase inhibitor-like YbhB/YbcL family protein
MTMPNARRAFVLTASLLLAAGSARAVDHPDLFVVSSSDFADNGMLKPANAGTGNSVRGAWECGGGNVSPTLSWSHAPSDTKSYAILAEDPDAASGRGGPHWIMYGIPPAVTVLPRGAADKPGSPFVAGSVGRNHVAYSGPCAEPGAKPHHFIFMVFALDLAPDALPKGLDLDGFRKAIAGHNLAEASVMARYWRPPARKK